MNDKLSAEELDIVTSIEKNEWRSIENLEDERRRYQEYAAHALKKEKRVNIRISEHDLESIRKIAHDEGLPYQTLISSILHKFINGRLVDSRLVERRHHNAG